MRIMLKSKKNIKTIPIDEQMRTLERLEKSHRKYWNSHPQRYAKHDERSKMRSGKTRARFMTDRANSLLPEPGGCTKLVSGPFEKAQSSKLVSCRPN